MAGQTVAKNVLTDAASVKPDFTQQILNLYKAKIPL